MNLEFRTATLKDLTAVVRLLADDFLGQQRERLDDPLPERYIKAFREMENDPNNELIVAELNGEVVGTLQLIFNPSLNYQGGKRCTMESVRVDERFRGQEIGREMMLWAIERTRSEGCVSMQLTMHGERKDAHQFYENLGFSASHVRMKLKL